MGSKVLTTAKFGADSLFVKKNHFVFVLKTGIKQAAMRTQGMGKGVCISECAGGG